MRATGVIVRFLSLLDVAFMLLGVLMVTLIYADFQRRTEMPEQKRGLAEVADVGFIYLYAGWKGEQDGRCYLLSPDVKLGKEVRTDTPDDIREITSARERNNQVVLLLFSEDGWYSGWDAKKLADMEKTWGLKVVPVYNVPLSR